MRSLTIYLVLILFSSMLYSDNIDGLEVTYASKLDIQKTACHSGNIDGCMSVALHYANEPKESRDSQAMIKYANMACDSGNGDGCALLGLVYGTGDDLIKKDTELAMAYMKKACENKTLFGCAFLGNIYSTGTIGIPIDNLKSIEYLEKACNLGIKNTPMCMVVGYRYHEGKLVPRDYKKAVEYYKKDINLNSDNFSSPYLNIFEIDMVSNRDFDKKMVNEFKKRFKSDINSMMYMDMLDIFRLTSLGKSTSHLKWQKKYKAHKIDGWDFSAIDEWIETNKTPNIKSKLKNLRKIFKEDKIKETKEIKELVKDENEK